MKIMTLFAALSLAAWIGPLLADTFTGKTIPLKDGDTAVFRGVINSVTVPVLDELELGPVQNGFFFFTTDEYTLATTDENGKPARTAAQTMFHLTPGEAQSQALEKLVGKPVEMKATAFEAHTRHHRSPILLEPLSVKALPEGN